MTDFEQVTFAICGPNGSGKSGVIDAIEFGLTGEIGRLTGRGTKAHRIAKSEDDEACLEAINGWGKELGTFKAQLGTFDEVIGLKDRLAEDRHAPPRGGACHLAALRQTIEAKPDQSAAVEGQTFLTTAQLRLKDYRAAARGEVAAKAAYATAKLAYEKYCRATEAELNALYADIQADFSGFYRTINDDEATFTAEPKPKEASI